MKCMGKQNSKKYFCLLVEAADAAGDKQIWSGAEADFVINNQVQKKDTVLLGAAVELGELVE